MSDFSMFYTGWHQLSPIGYLPMQYVKKRRYYIDYQCFIYLAIYSE